MSELMLGIDTSNYKTSVAVTNETGKILYQRSEFLKVERGERGLRQSVAFFQHCQVLPSFIEEAMSVINPQEIAAIAASARPRNVEGSYMPVFLSGLETGRVLAASLQVPMYEFSHQEGHIEAILSSLPSASSSDPKLSPGDAKPPRAASAEHTILGSETDESVKTPANIYPQSELRNQPFLLFHLSGGTTECLLCRQTADGYQTEIVGGTKDISIGQLLDRTGVRLGFDFPAGKYLDHIALTQPVTELPSRVKINDGYFNLSGMETQILRRAEEQGEGIVPGIFVRIQSLLHDTAVILSKKYNVNTVIMAGGLSASNTLRRYSESWSETADGCRILFGDPMLSGDNAVGISLLGGRKLHETC